MTIKLTEASVRLKLEELGFKLLENYCGTSYKHKVLTPLGQEKNIRLADILSNKVKFNKIIKYVELNDKFLLLITDVVYYQDLTDDKSISFTELSSRTFRNNT